jgi:uncharacterized protein YaaN involved in tellurite resistance
MFRMKEKKKRDIKSYKKSSVEKILKIVNDPVFNKFNSYKKRYATN